MQVSRVIVDSCMLEYCARVLLTTYLGHAQQIWERTYFLAFKRKKEYDDDLSFEMISSFRFRFQFHPWRLLKNMFLKIATFLLCLALDSCSSNSEVGFLPGDATSRCRRDFNLFSSSYWPSDNATLWASKSKDICCKRTPNQTCSYSGRCLWKHSDPGHAGRQQVQQRSLFVVHGSG